MPQLEQLLGQFPKDVKVVFKNYPLPSHALARPAALAALAAAEQGKFWPFHDRLFQATDALSQAKFKAIASDLGLDLPRFEKAQADRSVQDLVNRDTAEAGLLGVRGTPTVFINGRAVKNRSVPGMVAMVQEELGSKGRSGKRAP